jgi:hypothetical protein
MKKLGLPLVVFAGVGLAMAALLYVREAPPVRVLVPDDSPRPSQRLPPQDLEKLTPPPGEAVRLQPKSPPPAIADPATIAAALEGKALPAGDAMLLSTLKFALETKEAPTYKMALDIPLSDNAAQAVRDELHDWIERKMASLGFKETAGKPSLSFNVHIDPAEAGKYTLSAVIRVAGAPRLEKTFELPAAYASDRMEKALSETFSSPPKAEVAAKP